PAFDRGDDREAQLFLNREDVGAFAIVLARPGHVTGANVDEPRRDHQLLTRLSNAAFDDVPHVQFAANVLEVSVFSLEPEGRRASSDAQIGNARQRRDQLFSESVAKVIAVVVGAEIQKRQYGDGWLRVDANRSGSVRAMRYRTLRQKRDETKRGDDSS